MIENSFELYFDEHNIQYRVEKLIHKITESQSRLETLASSYQSALLLQNQKIINKFISLKNENIFEPYVVQLTDFQTRIREYDFNKNSEILKKDWCEWEQNCSQLKHDILEDSTDLKKIRDIRKEAHSFLNRCQLKLEEYCKRLIVEAERHRNYKNSFADDLSLEMTHLENDFVSGLKTKFQKERVVILSEFINVFDFLNTSKCNERVDSYQKVINTRKVLVKHNFDLKNQLRIIQFNTRKNPFVHFGSITKLKTSATNILSKIKTLHQDYADVDGSLNSNIDSLTRSRNAKYNILTNILFSTSTLEIELCKTAQHAVRLNLINPKELCNISALVCLQLI